MTTETEAKIASPPENKKAKVAVPESPDEEWPECWYLKEDEIKNQKEENRQEPNKPAPVPVLRSLGISYWSMDADAHEYPVKEVPWDPKDAVDPKLKQLRDDRGYSYADIITIHPDHLPDYEKKVEAFFEEHIHDAEEIRYCLKGSGFFDVRDKDDKWIRIHVKKGCLMTLPEGIYHRFTCDESDFIHVMRLFIGQPVWTPFNRPQEEHPSRKKYLESLLEEKKEGNGEKGEGNGEKQEGNGEKQEEKETEEKAE